MNCIENLQICKASCCRYLGFPARNLTEDQIKYYELHGCKIKRNSNRSYMIIVPIKCNALMDNCLCALHESGKKPDICKVFNSNTKENYLITEGCNL